MATISFNVELEIDGGFEVETVKDLEFLKDAISGAKVYVVNEEMGLTIAEGEFIQASYRLKGIEL